MSGPLRFDSPFSIQTYKRLKTNAVVRDCEPAWPSGKALGW